jgi:hypothetical protein
MKTKRRPWTYSSYLLAAACCASLLSAGCSDDDSPAPRRAGDFVASANVPSGDEYFTLIGYLSTLDTADAALASVTEHAGFAGLLRSPAAPNAYFVGSGDAATIKRYDSEGGEVVAGQTISFSDLGLQYAPGSTETAFDADGLAYSVSVDQALVIVWNVETMKIERTIALDGLTREGFASVYPLATTLRGKTLLFPVSYTNWESGEALPLTVLVSIDLATDQVTLAEDGRCSGIRGLAAAGDGTLYGATDGFFAVRRRLYGEVAGTEPCILRVLGGETRFDADYRLSSRDLYNAAIVGDLSISHDGETILFNVFDENLQTIAGDAVYGDVARAPGWRVFRASAASLRGSAGVGVEPVPGLEPGARQGIRFNVGGRTWVAIADADYSSSQLFEVPASAAAAAGPRFSGSVSEIYEVN